MTVKFTKPVKPALESSVQAVIREALGLEPDLYLMRNAQWEGHIFDDRSGKGRYVKAGLPPGSADLVGILMLQLWVSTTGVITYGPRNGPGKPTAIVGLFFAFEVKRAKGGALSEAQLAWGALVQSKGAFYSVPRSVEEAKAALTRARRGERE